jgi:hypothetical protein
MLVFWNGLWSGVPRADHIAYLHQISQFSDLWDIILNAPSWNRTQSSAGDFILFRPLLYLQLGSFYYAFEYKFEQWQIASLTMHVIVVLGVHSILSLGHLRLTPYPLLLALFFGVSLLGAELVLWSHVAGYILFSAFFIYSVYFLIVFFEKKNERYAWASMFLGFLSQFTYEFGVILNIFIVVILFYKHYFCNTCKSNSSKKNINNIKWAVIFLLGLSLYPVLSIMSLWVNGYDTIPTDGHVYSIQSLFFASYYAFKQIIFWLGCWVLPAAYDVHTGGKTVFWGLNLKSTSFIINLMVTLLISFIFFSFYGIKKTIIKIKKFNLTSVIVVSFLFLFSYSFMIAYGRTLQRGLYIVLENNIYYSYIAYLISIMAVALVSIKYNKEVRSKGEVVSETFNFTSRNIFISLGISILIGINAYGVFEVSKIYRNNYSPNKLELISAVSDWLANTDQESSVYFFINSRCESNELLPWFDENHLRKNMGWKPPVTLIDALFPEKSLILNKQKLLGKSYSIAEFNCSPH